MEARFAAAIAQRLDAAGIVEVYLFPPIRSGLVETAAAVVAVADGPAGSVSAAGRHVVYTATYRHTRKGPDRGAWSVEVIAQADASLDAVAAAVRGVYRRSSEGAAADADRLTGEEFRALAGVAALVEAPAADETSPEAGAAA